MTVGAAEYAEVVPDSSVEAARIKGVLNLLVLLCGEERVPFHSVIQFRRSLDGACEWITIRIPGKDEYVIDPSDRTTSPNVPSQDVPRAIEAAEELASATRERFPHDFEASRGIWNRDKVARWSIVPTRRMDEDTVVLY